MRRLLRTLVPRSWTGHEALLAASLLRQALDAVWEVHGPDMVEALADCPVERWTEFYADDLQDVDEDDVPY